MIHYTEVDIITLMDSNICPLRVLSSSECITFRIMPDNYPSCLEYQNVNESLETSVSEIKQKGQVSGRNHGVSYMTFIETIVYSKTKG